jgi:hypothetical protein
MKIIAINDCRANSTDGPIRELMRVSHLASKNTTGPARLELSLVRWSRLVHRYKFLFFHPSLVLSPLPMHPLPQHIAMQRQW